MAEPIDKDISITKLNSSNYQEWKRDIRMVLIMKDLWDILCYGDPETLEK